ncbi:hypothetical protein DKZ23_03380 [Limosilactobacillus reuteri]|uniref:Uncharacterized protein n=1 Tax=Limosilactobacillus reuteri TaxID=1598 RepID=A0A317GIA1_LIMRT|nr:hypothetical protein DKZ23_03380 [Limosilactobacillus reuteri]PWT52656.1 hypothetical protein DKZ33_03390 [Limosilactobacillus reuteri]PWT63261.1 hypothetical protein DKZ32_03375 [Limosilactobacillus reuteri]
MYLFLRRFLKKSQEIYSRQKNEQTVAFLSVRSSVYLKFILIWLFFIGIVFFLIWNELQISLKICKIKKRLEEKFFLSASMVFTNNSKITWN